ncbi:YibE/F family protein [Desulfovibrio inopinatus]|uniref:YibE/F family protein n=1 Tax=Desulfovibrio inopinatus TaxID=102109 RepID=UPI0003FD797A|nr:YibE/F family protein [Desulfovibrio inopinatus]
MRDGILTLVFLALTVGLYFVPTGYEQRIDERAVRCRGEVIAVDNSDMNRHGIVISGDQGVTVRILDGPYIGQEFRANNPLMAKMDIDKLFKVGDVALVVLTIDADGKILYVNPQDHYRIDLELILLGLFAGLLLLFGGMTGAKALLSFVFSGMLLWKVLVPGLLQGYDPLYLSISVVSVLTAAIIFLVGGISRKGFVAFAGAMLGVLTSCVLAIYFTGKFRLNGATLPFSETLLYSGYAHLDIARIYVSAVFLAASGAVMDLAMDVAASLDEVVRENSDITLFPAMAAGLRVGRAVVGTMTTTLLLAYSGGYITLVMAFMAQGVPLVNLVNMKFVAAEVLKTLVGSFGLVMVAPFTAMVGAVVFTRWPKTPANACYQVIQPESPNQDTSAL